MAGRLLVLSALFSALINFPSLAGALNGAIEAGIDAIRFTHYNKRFAVSIGVRIAIKYIVLVVVVIVVSYY